MTTPPSRKSGFGIRRVKAKKRLPPELTRSAAAWGSRTKARRIVAVEDALARAWSGRPASCRRADQRRSAENAERRWVARSRMPSKTIRTGSTLGLGARRRRACRPGAVAALLRGSRLFGRASARHWARPGLVTGRRRHGWGLRGLKGRGTRPRGSAAHGQEVDADDVHVLRPLGRVEPDICRPSTRRWSRTSRWRGSSRAWPRRPAGITWTLRNDLASVTPKASQWLSGDQAGGEVWKPAIWPVKMTASLCGSPASLRVMTRSSRRLRT